MDKYMKTAIDEARKGIRAGHGGPFGCVIVKDGEIVGKGHNEVIKRHDPTCHGEMMAIRDACKKAGSHVFQAVSCILRLRRVRCAGELSCGRI